MRALTIATCVTVATATAAADEGSPPESRPLPIELAGWRFDIQPYAYVPLQVTGHVTVRDREVPIDITLADIVDHLSFAAMLHAEAWKGRLGLILDTVYTRTGADGTLPRGEPFDVTSKAVMVDAHVGFAVGSWRLRGPSRPAALSIELDLGGRLFWNDADLDLGPLHLSKGDTSGLMVVGARIPVRLSDGWLVFASSNLGFPDIQWMVTGGGELDLSRTWALRLAYRATGIDRDGKDPGLDVISHGPYLGVGIRFGAGPVF